MASTKMDDPNRSNLDRLRCVAVCLIVGLFLTRGALGLFASTRSNSLTRFTFTEYHMGVDARLVVYAKDQTQAVEACSAAFARIAELDALMSDYRKDSELMRLCRATGGQRVRVSKDLFRVLGRALTVSKETAGAFDVTVGPLVQVWRQARKFKVLPLPDEIESAKALVGWEKLHLDSVDQTVKLDVPGMKLDLGGIAKGYAGDAAQVVLKRYGVSRALVELGGDIVVSGPPPGAKGWKIRVPNAADDKGPKDLFFSNCAVSTSGDTEQFIVLGGKRYSHVVDPRTGWAVTNRVQATVVAKDGFTSDPMSKIFALLDARKARQALRKHGIVQYYVRTIRD